MPEQSKRAQPSNVIHLSDHSKQWASTDARKHQTLRHYQSVAHELHDRAIEALTKILMHEYPHRPVIHLARAINAANIAIKNGAYPRQALNTARESMAEQFKHIGKPQ
ncbi:MAG: hypothetical protein ACTSY1_02345 [Alphaproteobacteria bacterium]